MSLPLIFVSHSGKGAAHKRQMEELQAALGRHGLDAWLDFQRIDTGDRWNDEISQNLRACQSAVVVFSKEALQSEFVRYEVSYLAVRARTEAPNFRLHALTLDKLKPDDIAKGFYKSIRLEDFQFGTWRNRDKDIAGFAGLVPKEFVPLTPAGELDEYLTRIFAELSPAILRTAAASLGWTDARNLGLDEAVAQFFARELMTRSLPEQIAALSRIRKEIDRKSDAVEVFEAVAPCWVDMNAATILRSLGNRPPGSRAVLINGDLPSFTPRMLLKRAYPIQDRPLVESGAGANPVPAASPVLVGATEPQGRAADEDLLHEVSKSFERWIGVPEAQWPTLLAAIEQGPLPLPAIALLLKDDDLALLESLLNSAFHRALFVILTGPQIPTLPPALIQRVKVLQPELRHDKDSCFHNEAFASAYYHLRTAYLPKTASSPTTRT